MPLLKSCWRTALLENTGTMIRVGLQTFDADTGNPVVLVAKVPFESNIGNEVMVNVDSQHIEFSDGRKRGFGLTSADKCVKVYKDVKH